MPFVYLGGALDLHLRPLHPQRLRLHLHLVHDLRGARLLDGEEHLGAAAGGPPLVEPGEGGRQQ